MNLASHRALAAVLRVERLCSPKDPGIPPRDKRRLAIWQGAINADAWELTREAPRCPCGAHLIMRRPYGSADFVELMCAGECGWRCVTVQIGTVAA